jgi:hypothetical protein
LLFQEHVIDVYSIFCCEIIAETAKFSFEVVHFSLSLADLASQACSVDLELWIGGLLC